MRMEYENLRIRALTAALDSANEKVSRLEQALREAKNEAINNA